MANTFSFGSDLNNIVPNYIEICNRQNSYAGSGETFTHNAWNTRVVNTVIWGSDYASLPGANIIRLVPGTYTYEIDAPGHHPSGGSSGYYLAGKVKLYQETAPAGFVSDSYSTYFHMHGQDAPGHYAYSCGRVTVPTSVSYYEFTIRHWISTNPVTSTGGYAVGDGSYEFYTVIRLLREVR